MRSRGFTIIELLVVIAIISILSAILFPVFAQARAKARQTACTSNLRQIGLALTQYIDDYDGAMPNSYWGSFSAPSDMGANYKWMDAIYPYVKNEQVFDCPDDHSSPHYRYRSGVNYGSYGQNGAYKSGNLESPPRSAPGKLMTLAKIAAPAETVWAADCNNADLTHPGGSSGGAYGFTWPDPLHNPVIVSIGGGTRQLEQAGLGGGISERHVGMANVVFCDGHAKSLKLETLAVTHVVNDPAFGGPVNVLFRFTVQDD